MSTLTHKPKAPEHARSPTWSAPSEPVQVSNAEVAARAHEEGSAAGNGFFMDDSFLGFKWQQADGEGCHFGYDWKSGHLGAGATTDMGRVHLGLGARMDDVGHERGTAIGAGFELEPKMGDIRFGVRAGQIATTSDDTAVVHEGATVLVRRRFGASHQGAGGGNVLAVGVGANVHNAVSAERTRRIPTPEWVALVAEHGSASDAARAIVGALDVAASARDLGDGERFERSFAGGGGGKGSLSVIVDAEESSSVDVANTLVAERRGSSVTFTSSAVFGRMEGKSLGGGLKNLFTKSVIRHDSGVAYDTTGTLTLDVDEDAHLIELLESTASAAQRLTLIHEHGGSIRYTRVDRNDTKGQTQAVMVGADRTLDRRLETEQTLDGRRNFTADSTLSDDWKFMGHTVWGDARTNCASLQQGEDGRYNLDLQALETQTGWGPGLPELDVFAPAGMAVDLFTDKTTEQTAGLSLDADQLDAVVAMAGQDAWSYGGNSRYGGAGDAWWMSLGRKLEAAEALPERERRMVQAEAIASFIAAGGEVEAFGRLLDPDFDGKVEHATLTEWPESIRDGAARYDEFEARIEAADIETIAGLLGDLDQFTFEVGRCDDFTMAGAKPDLLERLGAMRERATSLQHDLHGEDYDVDLAIDANHASLAAGLATCGAYAGDESRMYADLDSAHDKEAGVEKLSQFYAHWRDAVLAVRRTYGFLGIAPQHWRVSGPGGKRTAYEPTAEAARRQWVAVRQPDDTGFERRIQVKLEY